MSFLTFKEIVKYPSGKVGAKPWCLAPVRVEKGSIGLSVQCMDDSTSEILEAGLLPPCPDSWEENGQCSGKEREDVWKASLCGEDFRSCLIFLSINLPPCSEASCMPLL